MKKTVLLTGASSGIGKASAIYFAQNGWNVAATMRQPEKELELIKIPGIRLYQLDVTDDHSISMAIEKVIHDFGKIDVLVNNAGYGLVGVFEASNDEQIQRQFNTNVFGLMKTTRLILPHFREHKKGTIINISSMGGRITFPIYSLYHSTKWAVEGFSEALNYELNPFNIKVKLVEPGAIKTDFNSRSQDLMHKEGLTAYDNYEKVIMKNMQKEVAKAPGPDVVAKVIFKAANETKNKIRYTVGGSGPILLFLRRIIGDVPFMKMVRKLLERK